jgi:hypothetical protein
MNAELALVAQENPVHAEAVAGLARSPQAQALCASIVASDRPALRRPPRRALVLVAAVLVVCGGTAVGAVIALTGSEVQEFLPRGHAVFTGTDPTCVAVRENVEYDCTLAHSPTGMTITGSDGLPAFKGTVVQIVDGQNHIAGGCRARTDDGMHWRCYLGDEAVKQQILDKSLLGATQVGPAHG